MMKKLLQLLGLVAAALTLGACNTGEDYANFLTFHIAEQNTSEGIYRSRVTMPVSGFEVIANDGFVLSHAHLHSVKVAKVTMPDGLQTVRGLLFNFTSEGSRILYRETASNRNGWILMNERYKPVGLRKIDAIIQDGNLFMLVEFPPETDLHEKAADYNEGIRIVQAKIKKKKEGMFAAW